MRSNCDEMFGSFWPLFDEGARIVADVARVGVAADDAEAVGQTLVGGQHQGVVVTHGVREHRADERIGRSRPWASARFFWRGPSGRRSGLSALPPR